MVDLLLAQSLDVTTVAQRLGAHLLLHQKSRGRGIICSFERRILLSNSSVALL